MMSCLGKRLSKCKGLSLVEMLIALALLLIIIPLTTMLFFYGSRSFAVGEEQSELQQHVRLVADYVLGELRYAHGITILADAPDPDDPDLSGWNLIYVDDGSAIGRREGVIGSVISGLDPRVDFEFEFDQGSTPGTIAYTITGTVPGGREYAVEAEIATLNTRNVSGGPGAALYYASPLPDEIEIAEVVLRDRVENEIVYDMVRGAEVDETLGVQIHTRGVPNHLNVSGHLQVYRTEGGIGDSVAEMKFLGAPDSDILDNELENEIFIDVEPSIFPGSYSFRAHLEIPDSVVAALPRIISFTVWPELGATVEEHVTQPESVLTIALLVYRELKDSEVIRIAGWAGIEDWLEEGESLDFDISSADSGDSIEIASYDAGTGTLEMNVTTTVSPPETQPTEPAVITLMVYPRGDSSWQDVPSSTTSAVNLLATRSDVDDLGAIITVYRGAVPSE